MFVARARRYSRPCQTDIVKFNIASHRRLSADQASEKESSDD